MNAEPPRPEPTDERGEEPVSPWRFLTPLDAAEGIDRELVEVTRQEELLILADMIATSRTSLLYAFSGNGKSSLINAGIVPLFKRRGYAVFKTRPRPPWSAHDPARAFKDCLLRSLELPLVSQTDLIKLRGVRERLGTASDPEARDLVNALGSLEARLARLQAASSNTDEIAAYLEAKLDEPLVRFVAEIQALLGPETRLLFICDQFEELFVHYQGTPQLDEFVEQLGEVWADPSLKVHFLFSMREDWVGSMIAFREVIPDVFTNYYRLDPLRRSRAETVLTLPLRRLGRSWGEGAVERILDDLVHAYSANQTDRYNDISLAPSPGKDSFLELPALQVVAEEMWRTHGGQKSPFSVEHYESLEGAGKVLDRYLADQLAELSREEAAEDFLDALRIDCLYCLTDRVRHRRASLEKALLRESAALIPAELNVDPVVTPERVSSALAPLEKRRLVHSHPAPDGQRQYELAHDFAVRSVVRLWKDLDRKRTENVALLRHERERKETRYADLAARERWALKFLQWAPLFGMALLIASFVLLPNPWKDAEVYQTYGSFGIALLFGLVLGMAILNHRWMSTGVGLLGLAAAVLVSLQTSPFFTSSQVAYQEFPAVVRGTGGDLDYVGIHVPSRMRISVTHPYYTSFSDYTKFFSAQGTAITANSNLGRTEVELASGFYWAELGLYSSDYDLIFRVEDREEGSGNPAVVFLDFRDDLLGHQRTPVSAYFGAGLLLLALIVLLILYLLSWINLNESLGGSARRRRVVRVMVGEFIDLAIFLIVVAAVAVGLASLNDNAIEEVEPLTAKLIFFLGALIAAGGVIWVSGILLIRWKTTLGFDCVGLRVTTPEGEPLSPWQAMVRQTLFVFWTMVNVVFGIGWLLGSTLIISNSKRHQNFYDTWAGSVVRERPKEPEVELKELSLPA
jgi:uncharacterized RDD family membrane protein YckC